MNNKVIIIAEAGVNHNGNLELAKELISAAAKAGADYVKFQTFSADKIVSKSAKKASYQEANQPEEDSSQYSMLKKLELPFSWYKILMDHSNQLNIKFISTGFDLDSIDFLDNLSTPFFKIPSGEITNKPYLVHIASKKKPIILSTGMSSLLEVKDALKVLEENGINKDNITVLHCTTEYPAPIEEINLKAMLSMKESLGVNIGYSDHTIGFEVPIAAVALGATIIEKHFTIDRNLPGPDHKASLEPSELKEMIRSIRNIELALSGSGQKEPSHSEIKNLIAVRKSIVAAVNISKGELFSEENLSIKRPGNGLSPMLWDQVLGTHAKRNFVQDEMIEL